MALLAAEFLYALPPADPARTVIIDGLRRRCAALRPGDAVLVLAGSAAVRDQAAALLADFPHLTSDLRVVMPLCRPDGTFAMTDRWARIDAALAVAAEHAAIYTHLLMPALDARYDARLIARLLAESGGRTPISPWTPCHHAGDGLIAAAMNAAFNRDRTFKRRLQRGDTQQWWGKLGLLPTAIAADVRAAVRTDHLIWEDDLAIDRALTLLAWPARTVWIADPALYHLYPAVFTRADLYATLDRHLHYSLHGGSGMLHPPDAAQRRWMRRDPAYAAAVTLADALIAEAQAALTQRLLTTGESAVIWGAYRITARRHDPFVRVESASVDAPPDPT